MSEQNDKLREACGLALEFFRSVRPGGPVLASDQAVYDALTSALAQPARAERMPDFAKLLPEGADTYCCCQHGADAWGGDANTHIDFAGRRVDMMQTGSCVAHKVSRTAAIAHLESAWRKERGQ